MNLLKLEQLCSRENGSSSNFWRRVQFSFNIDGILKVLLNVFILHFKRNSKGLRCYLSLKKDVIHYKYIFVQILGYMFRILGRDITNEIDF